MEISDLNDVRIFAVAGQEGTLTAAAQKLHLPPSTVSRALTRLEKSLNVLLVRRSSRGLVLTDAGKEYLQSCRRAMRTLRDGGETLTAQRERPQGLLRIACPMTMARAIFAPLLSEFLRRYPEMRIELETYASGWHQEPQDDIDIFFKVRAPRESTRRVRLYPGTQRSLFASKEYADNHGLPATPDLLSSHPCIGSGVWKLSRGKNIVSPSVQFKVVVSDPQVQLELTLDGLGIAILPTYMGLWPETRHRLVPVLGRWSPEPINLCALFSGPSRLTPKVQVLLNFLEEYIATDKDPRLRGLDRKGLFTGLIANGITGP